MLPLAAVTSAVSARSLTIAAQPFDILSAALLDCTSLADDVSGAATSPRHDAGKAMESSIIPTSGA